MKVVFLDVDGVLNYQGCEFFCGRYVGIDPKKVEYLKRIIDETGAIIVLTSSWKDGWEPIYKEDQDMLATYLDKNLTKFGLKIISKTYDHGNDRGAGIKKWISDRPVESYVILDDCSFDYEREGITDRFVHTRWKDGLTKGNVAQAIDILLTK